VDLFYIYIYIYFFFLLEVLDFLFRYMVSWILYKQMKKNQNLRASN